MLTLPDSRKFRAMLDQSRRQIEVTGGIPNEQFWRQVEAETHGHSVNRLTGHKPIPACSF
jgi:hypothetical protein